MSITFLIEILIATSTALVGYIILAYLTYKYNKKLQNNSQKYENNKILLNLILSHIDILGKAYEDSGKNEVDIAFRTLNEYVYWYNEGNETDTESPESIPTLMNKIYDLTSPDADNNKLSFFSLLHKLRGKVISNLKVI